MTKTYFFCGIGGNGMSALAQLLLVQGYGVAGSDRAHDQGQEAAKFNALEQLGARLYPQDGSGITASNADVLVVSTAVEDTIPDVKAAKAAGVPILHRAELLAELAHTGTLLTVGGTSGKSTTTAMLGHILAAAGQAPTIINGAAQVGQKHPELSHVAVGQSHVTVIEVDESDGSILKFHPQVAVLNNIALDHKPMAELRQIFSTYLQQAEKGAVLNLDCAEAMACAPDVKMGKTIKTFSLTNPKADVFASHITPESDGVSFRLCGKYPVRLKVFGQFNVANALAAIAAATLVGVAPEKAAKSLQTFKGMKRRLEVLGAAKHITVIDDFGHNPHKIAASLDALKATEGRLVIVYQPHGFGPTKLMRHELVATFTAKLAATDKLFLPEIYFAGGTAQKDISSADLVAELKAAGKDATFVPLRADIPAQLWPQLKAGDRVCVMGARDNTLADFARTLLHGL